MITKRMKIKRIDLFSGFRYGTCLTIRSRRIGKRKGNWISASAIVFNLVGSLNIITQYADFDLLKKQAPEEAKRLGIE